MCSEMEPTYGMIHPPLDRTPVWTHTTGPDQTPRIVALEKRIAELESRLAKLEVKRPDPGFARFQTKAL